MWLRNRVGRRRPSTADSRMNCLPIHNHVPSPQRLISSLVSHWPVLPDLVPYLSCGCLCPDKLFTPDRERDAGGSVCVALPSCTASLLPLLCFHIPDQRGLRHAMRNNVKRLLKGMEMPCLAFHFRLPTVIF